MRITPVTKETKTLLRHFVKGATSKELSTILKVPHSRILNVSKKFQQDPTIGFGVPRETTYKQRLPRGGIVTRRAEKLDMIQSAFLASEFDKDMMDMIYKEMHTHNSKEAVVLKYHSIWMHLYMKAQFNVHHPVQCFGSAENEEDYKNMFKLKHALEDGLLSRSLYMNVLFGKKRLTAAQSAKVRKILDAQEDVALFDVKVNGHRNIRGMRISQFAKLVMQVN